MNNWPRGTPDETSLRRGSSKASTASSASPSPLLLAGGEAAVNEVHRVERAPFAEVKAPPKWERETFGIRREHSQLAHHLRNDTEVKFKKVPRQLFPIGNKTFPHSTLEGLRPSQSARSPLDIKRKNEGEGFWNENGDWMEASGGPKYGFFTSNFGCVRSAMWIQNSCSNS